MLREELEHIVRASAAIISEYEVIVVGSQSILGSYWEDELPPEAIASREADILPLDDPDEQKSDLIEGSIGEFSMFNDTFGVYADGVSVRTSRLPAGWRDRLVALRSPNTNGITGWCLEPHDVVIAKLYAGREKDLSFSRALLREGIVEPAVLLDRLAATDLDDADRVRITRVVESAPRR